MSKEARALAQKLAAYNDPLVDIPDDELDDFSQDFRVRARGFKGDRVKELRKSKGVSITQLAQFSGVSSNAIQQMEDGERQPGAKAAQALAEALGTKKNYFYDVKETQRLKQAGDIAKQADALSDRLAKYKASRGLQYKQLRAALEKAGAKVSLPTMTQWIVYHNKPSERFIDPVNKALDILEKEPVEQEPGTKKVTVTILYMQSGPTFVLTPDRQVLYTDQGKPVKNIEQVELTPTKTEQEIFGDKTRPAFNRDMIAAEVPVIAKVPVQDEWVIK